MPEIKKPHISHSQVDMFFGCGEQYRRRYIEKEIIPPGIKAMRGISVHKTAQVNFKQKIESHIDLPVKELKEVASNEYDVAVKGGVSFTNDEVSQGVQNVINETKDKVIMFTDVLAESVNPDVQPVMVEQKITIQLPKHPFDLLGIIDIFDDKDQVRDIKTGARKNQAQVDRGTQLTWYAMSIYNKLGLFPSKLIIDNLVENKKSITYKKIETERDSRDVDNILNRINLMQDMVQKGYFPPASPDHWRCSPDWCGYWSTCKYVNPERISKASLKENEE